MPAYKRPLGGRGIRECFKVELEAQVHRQLVGEHLVAGSDNADDLTGVDRYEGMLVGHPHLPG